MSEARVIGLAEALASLPRSGSPVWPDGTWFDTVLDRPGMSIMIFAPRGTDYQTTHDRDEIYVGARGHAALEIAGEVQPFGAGQLAFVPKDVAHRFRTMSADFSAWVIFVARI